MENSGKAPKHGWAGRMVWLLVGLVIGLIGTVAGTDVAARQQAALEIHEQWTSPEMQRARVTAGRAERIARELMQAEAADRRGEFAISLLDWRDSLMAFGPAAVENADASSLDESVRALDALASAPQDQQVEIVNSQYIASLRAELASLEASDDIRLIAALFDRAAALSLANRVDRQLLAELLGEHAEFWSGGEYGDSFEYVRCCFDERLAAFDLDAFFARARLGARIIARDHIDGAPNRWMQVVGFNESGWEREERQRISEVWSEPAAVEETAPAGAESAAPAVE